MRWIIAALSTTVGRKFVMGITGLLLVGFLVVHLGGNLLLFVGPEAYNHYAESLHSQEWLLKIAELILFALFLSHLILAFSTRDTSHAARRSAYRKKDSKRIRDLFDRLQSENFMFVSGAVLFFFVLMHLWDFTIEGRAAAFYEGRTPYEKAVGLLRSFPTWIVYLGCCAFLMPHLGHGIASAFQSLGFGHPKYRPLIRKLSIALAIALTVGFMSFPLWALIRSDS